MNWIQWTSWCISWSISITCACKPNTFLGFKFWMLCNGLSMCLFSLLFIYFSRFSLSLLVSCACPCARILLINTTWGKRRKKNVKTCNASCVSVVSYTVHSYCSIYLFYIVCVFCFSFYFNLGALHERECLFQ